MKQTCSWAHVAFDDESVAGIHLHLSSAAQLLACAIGPFHLVMSRLARLAAGHAVGPDLAMPGQDRRRHRFAETDAQADVIATGDGDLLVLHPYQGIQILNAADTLRYVLKQPA